MVKHMVVALLVMLLPIFGQNLKGQKKHPHLTVTDLQRIEAKKKWISAAEQIYLKTRDEEAKDVVEAILRNMLTVKPTPPNNMQFLEAAKSANSPWTAFLPMTIGDTKMDHMRSFSQNRNIFASYGPDSRVITVRDFEPVSEFWKGIMLLHEAHHAGDLIFQPYDWHNPQVFAEKERDVYNFQNRLTAKIGGLLYDQLLQKEISRMRTEFRKAGIDGMRRQKGAYTNISIPNRTEYYPELDKALTPALSLFEKDARQTVFWIHAVFRMYELDRGQGADAESGKALFLRTVYTEGGLFKK